MKQKFTITGMTCAACSSRVEKVTSQLPGVTSAQVNLLAGTMVAQFDEKQTTPEQIIAAITASGYGASVAGGKEQNTRGAQPMAVQQEADTDM